ncbi:MAG: FKBP-type peptidyl-prolyl cis-trans isomerase [Elusimicrobia bacterium]|nr:FKBP-type peptidyl-prolyl cis-trans isomerase [Elusimicrobiota bacterium]
MRLLTAVLFVTFAALPALAAGASSAPETKAQAPKVAAKRAPQAAPSTEEEKTLYALGLVVGRNLTTFSLSASEVGFVELGLRDAALGKEPQVDLQVYGPKLEALNQSRAGKKAAQEKTKAKSFLDKAAKEPGASASSSGLIYTDIRAGTGDSPKATDKVKVHYHGTLTDGKVFDSSVQRGQPAEFPLNGVIPCWTEGVQKMKVGGKAKLVCPSKIAYGDAGSPPVIPGGAALIFEVELLDIVKP